MNPFIIFAIVSSLVAIIFGVILTRIIKKKDPGNEKIIKMMKDCATLCEEKKNYY